MSFFLEFSFSQSFCFFSGIFMHGFCKPLYFFAFDRFSFLCRSSSKSIQYCIIASSPGIAFTFLTSLFSSKYNYCLVSTRFRCHQLYTSFLSHMLGIFSPKLSANFKTLSPLAFFGHILNLRAHFYIYEFLCPHYRRNFPNPHIVQF